MAWFPGTGFVVWMLQGEEIFGTLLCVPFGLAKREAV